MSKEQIEEMKMTPLDVLANDIYQHCPDLKDNYCGDTHCVSCLANALYNAGYRKQSEGEWIASDIPCEKYVCSVCGGVCWYYDYQGDVAKSRYCPNCGAKMKGGD